MIVSRIVDRAVFSSEKMGKVSLASGDKLYAGLNCFLPGQEHAAHVHADQDKLYYAIQGVGEVTLGEETRAFSAGDLALAPAGVSHGLKNTGAEPFVVLTVFAPPPQKR